MTVCPGCANPRPGLAAQAYVARLRRRLVQHYAVRVDTIAAKALDLDPLAGDTVAVAEARARGRALAKLARRGHRSPVLAPLVENA